MNMKACVLLCALVTVWWSVSVLHAERCTSRSKDRALNLQCQKLCLENSCPSYCICPNYKAVDTCAPLDVPENSTLKVLETASPGTVLLSVNVTGQEEWDLTLGRDQTVDGLVWSHLSSYLKLSQLGGTYEMSLERTLDLEWIFRRYGVKLRSLNLNLICRTSSAQDLTHELPLEIVPVNEYPPEFEVPLMLNVTEDTNVGTGVYTLRYHAMDMDVNPYGEELASFGVTSYTPDPTRDGRAFFEMTDHQKGSIVVHAPLDFEYLVSLDLVNLFLNLSASDSHNLTSYTTLTIEVLDADDLPPEFVYTGCPVKAYKTRPCLVSYTASVLENYQGPLTNITPALVQARDMDMANNEIEYNLDLAPDESLDNMQHFSINKTSGLIFLTSPFSQPLRINLVIVAKEMSPTGRSTQAILQVEVKAPAAPASEEEKVRKIPPPGGLSGSSTSHDGTKEWWAEDRNILIVICSLITSTVFICVIAVVLWMKVRKLSRHLRVHPMPDTDPPPGSRDTGYQEDLNNAASSDNGLARSTLFQTRSSAACRPASKTTNHLAGFDESNPERGSAPGSSAPQDASSGTASTCAGNKRSTSGRSSQDGNLTDNTTLTVPEPDTQRDVDKGSTSPNNTDKPLQPRLSPPQDHRLPANDHTSLSKDPLEGNTESNLPASYHPLALNLPTNIFSPSTMTNFTPSPTSYLSPSPTSLSPSLLFYLSPSPVTAERAIHQHAASSESHREISSAASMIVNDLRATRPWSGARNSFSLPSFPSQDRSQKTRKRPGLHSWKSVRWMKRRATLNGEMSIAKEQIRFDLGNVTQRPPSEPRYPSPKPPSENKDKQHICQTEGNVSQNINSGSPCGSDQGQKSLTKMTSDTNIRLPGCAQRVTLPPQNPNPGQSSSHAKLSNLEVVSSDQSKASNFTGTTAATHLFKATSLTDTIAATHQFTAHKTDSVTVLPTQPCIALYEETKNFKPSLNCSEISLIKSDVTTVKEGVKSQPIDVNSFNYDSGMHDKSVEKKRFLENLTPEENRMTHCKIVLPNQIDLSSIDQPSQKMFCYQQNLEPRIHNMFVSHKESAPHQMFVDPSSQISKIHQISVSPCNQEHEKHQNSITPIYQESKIHQISVSPCNQESKIDQISVLNLENKMDATCVSVESSWHQISASRHSPSLSALSTSPMTQAGNYANVLTISELPRPHTSAYVTSPFNQFDVNDLTRPWTSASVGRHILEAETDPEHTESYVPGVSSDTYSSNCQHEHLGTNFKSGQELLQHSLIDSSQSTAAETLNRELQKSGHREASYRPRTGLGHRQRKREKKKIKKRRHLHVARPSSQSEEAGLRYNGINLGHLKNHESQPSITGAFFSRQETETNDRREANNSNPALNQHGNPTRPLRLPAMRVVHCPSLQVQDIAKQPIYLNTACLNTVSIPQLPQKPEDQTEPQTNYFSSSFHNAASTPQLPQTPEERGGSGRENSTKDGS